MRRTARWWRRTVAAFCAGLGAGAAAGAALVGNLRALKNASDVTQILVVVVVALLLAVAAAFGAHSSSGGGSGRET
jgi:hypothetical protein